MSLCRTQKIFIWIRDKTKCVYCESNLSISEFTIDHVKPVSKGGTDDYNNVVCSCKSCNQLKGNVSLSETLINWVDNIVSKNETISYDVARKIRSLEKRGIIE